MKEAIRQSPLLAIALIIGAVYDLAAGVMIALALRGLFAIFGTEVPPESTTRLEGKVVLTPIETDAALHQPLTSIRAPV